MNIEQLVLKNRSYRRFNQQKEISLQTLESLVDLARLSASGRNIQSLKYAISNQSVLNSVVFECLAWAGYLPEWAGPIPGEQPAAYIIVVNDTSISANYLCDHGIAAQSILLGAVDKGLGGCMIASVNKPKLKSVLQLPDHLEIALVLALGEPVEQVVIDEITDGNVKYWRDDNQVHHVPKRKLSDIIIYS